MNKLVSVLLVSLSLVTFSQSAEEVVVPIVKVDALAVNDAAKNNDSKRVSEGVGVVGRVWGYVKDGVVYMASSTSDAVTSHPYLTAASVVTAVFVDKNNNYTGLWKKDSSSTSGSTSRDTSTRIRDESIIISTGNNSPVTIYSNRDSDNGKE